MNIRDEASKRVRQVKTAARKRARKEVVAAVGPYLALAIGLSLYAIFAKGKR